MGRQWPSSMVNAQRALGALVALMGLATVLTVLLEDEHRKVRAHTRTPSGRALARVAV